MARVTPIIFNTNGGEWSPNLYGRVDIAKYNNSFRAVRNFIPLVQGPSTRRPGFHFVAATKGDGVVSLIPFEFSTVQAYVIEAGHQYFRFYKDRGQILSGPAAYEIASPYLAGHVADLKWAQSADVLYLTHPSYAPRKLSRTGHTSWTLQTIEVLDGPYLDQNTAAYKTLAPSGTAVNTSVTLAVGVSKLVSGAADNGAGLVRLTLAAHDLQTGDAVYVAGVTGTLAANGTWTATRIDATHIDLQGSVFAGAYAGGGSVVPAIFAATDVGRLVRIKHGATWGYAKITAVADPGNVTADVKSAFGAATAQSAWHLGAWSDTTGYPSCVTFHEERLCFAGSTARPQTVWLSKSGDYENFAPTEIDGVVLADDAITVTISDNKVNAIRWMESGSALFLGTLGGEKLISASALGEALTPDNVTAKGQTTRGCANALPVRMDRAILFIQRAARKLFEISYSFENDSYTAKEISILAQHLARPMLKQLAYQATPWSVVWAARFDGTLVGITYERDQEALAWHAHPVGGADARVLSLACIPGNGQDELWAMIERTVGGVTRRYVEYLGYEFAPTDPADKAAAFFVDSGLSYSGPPVSAVGGLDHLEGQVVQVLADGAAHPDRTVAGGAIALARPASTVHVGLSYESELETMDLEAGSQIGTAQTKKKRIDKVAVRLLETLGCKIGRAGRMDEVLFRAGGDPMDAGPPLFTGDKTVEFPAGWDTAATVRVTQAQPLPCTVTAIVPSLTTNDG